MIEWVERLITGIADLFPSGSWLNMTFNVQALIAVVLVCGVCGAVGALVVGNRMAFFSDALAHCAFAGVTLGMILALWSQAGQESWIIPLVMVAFGIAVGVAIAYVREQTGLASDTVIGVFFAFAIGFGGMLFASLQTRTSLSPETFLFGSPLFVQAGDLIALTVLAVLLAFVLFRYYNQFVLASFNPSLARSRQVPLRFCNYLFIVLLALIVNLCLRAVGALLINAMLVVPAATAANVSRNLRVMFWCSIGVSLATGVFGLWLSYAVTLPIGRGQSLELGPAGTIVVLSVLAFFFTVAWRAWADRRTGRPGLAAVGGPPENASTAGEPLPSRPA
jgi:zinc transport system permease protein